MKMDFEVNGKAKGYVIAAIPGSRWGDASHLNFEARRLLGGRLRVGGSGLARLGEETKSKVGSLLYPNSRSK